MARTKKADSPVIDRLMAKVEITDTCWIFRGAGGRYGSITIDGRSYVAHRVAYELLRGPGSPTVRKATPFDEANTILKRGHRACRECGRRDARERMRTHIDACPGCGGRKRWESKTCRSCWSETFRKAP